MIQRETPAGRPRAHRDPAGPVRTCVGCRKRALAVDLVRLSTVSDMPGVNAVTVDTAGNLPGRGAWLHPDPQCLDVALRRRAIGRALRIPGSPDTTMVEELFRRLENR
ncbi:MAG: YlxR family protein [Mycolicibacterium neoaurum]|uniref:YlxR family protein n=1 Tax=Mycolicibacterium neoaurum TaxID=1795 RepID=UPI002FF5A047